MRRTKELCVEGEGSCYQRHKRIREELHGWKREDSLDEEEGMRRKSLAMEGKRKKGKIVGGGE